MGFHTYLFIEHKKRKMSAVTFACVKVALATSEPDVRALTPELLIDKRLHESFNTVFFVRLRLRELPR